MNENRPGDGPPSSTWDDAPWQPSSLSDSSLDRGPTPESADSAAPSPFSREGSDPSEALGASPPPPTSAPTAAGTPQPPVSAPATSEPAPPPSAWPGYPTAAPEPPASAASAVDPYGPPPVAPYDLPPTYGTAPLPPPPGFDPQPTAPYGYGGSGQAQPPAPQFPELPTYGVNPYEPAPVPYQPAYGGYSPYGVVPMSHPKATQALVFGILGLTLGMSCGIGGLFGIAGIVKGRAVQREIDADPSRYTGRGMATAGVGLGIAGLVILGLIVVFIVIGLAVS